MGFDIDKAFGKQCVDPVLSFGQALFPGIHYSVLFPPVASAKDMYEKYNAQYFERIANNHADVNQLPQPGDICIFAGAPEKGYTSTYANPDGTVGIVDHADKNYVYLLHQDSAESDPKLRLKQRSWRYTRCLGWLRPRIAAPPVIAAPAPVQAAAPGPDSRIGKTLFLHPVAQWSVYRVGQKPERDKRIGYLIPRNYQNGPGGKPGLSYKIVGVSSYPNTVTIVTDTYGRCDIYVDSDGEIL